MAQEPSFLPLTKSEPGPPHRMSLRSGWIDPEDEHVDSLSRALVPWVPIVGPGNEGWFGAGRRADSLAAGLQLFPVLLPGR